ncbi:MAG: hypothetical protein U1A78_03605 [Polyangia bacterium]
MALCLLGAGGTRAAPINDRVCRLVMTLWGLPAVLIDVGFTTSIILHAVDGEPIGRGAAIAEVVLMSIQLAGSGLGLGASLSEHKTCAAAVFGVTAAYSAGLLIHGAWVLGHPPPEPPVAMLPQPLLLPSLRPPRLGLAPGRIGSGLGLSVHGAF